MRNVLPPRRLCETLSFEHQGMNFTASTGRARYAAPILEIFLNSERLASSADSAARDAAIACSLALQFGCPLEVLAKAMTREVSGSPSSPIGFLLDLLAKQDAPR